MSTRSGKPYYHGNKRKRLTDNKDTSIDNNNTPNGKVIESDLNISNMSERELRRRKTIIKDNKFDNNQMSVKKIKMGLATESNWIISSVNKKPKRKGAKEDNEEEPENNSNAANIVTKPLRRRKSNVSDTTVEEIDKINTTYEKDSESNKKSKKTSKKSSLANDKENVKVETFDKSNLSVNAGIEQIDTGVALNSDNVTGKQLNKKKKKAKGGKKKRQKMKVEVEASGDSAMNHMVNTVEKDSKDQTFNESPNKKETIKKVLEVNSPVVKKHLRSTKKPVKDVVGKKKSLNTTFEKEVKDKTINKELESDDTASINSQEIKTDANEIYDKNETFEKDASQSFDTFKKGAITRMSDIKDKGNKSNLKLRIEQSIISREEQLEHDTEIVSSSSPKRKSLRSKTIHIDDPDAQNNEPTIDKKSKKNSLAKEDIEAHSVGLLSPASKRKSLRRQTMDNIHSDALASPIAETSNNRQSLVKRELEKEKVSSLLSPASQRKSLRHQTMDMSSSATEKLDSTFEITNSKQNLAKEDFGSNNISLLSPASKRKSLRRQTIEINDSTFDKSSDSKQSLVKMDLDIDKVSLLSAASKRKSLRRHTLDINDSNIVKLNSTFEKTSDSKQRVKEDSMTDKVNLLSPSSKRKSLRRQTTEISNMDTQKLDSTFDKTTNSEESLVKEDIATDTISLLSPTSKRKSLRRQTTDLNNSSTQTLNLTYDKSVNSETDTKRKSQRLSEAAIEQKLNTTFEKETVETERVSKSSLISSDDSVSENVSRISITSDDTVEDIGNTTPVLIESSMEESMVKESPTSQTPLKREGTFTKDGPEVQPQSPQTPGKRSSSIIPQPGCTPFHLSRNSQKKPMLNVTRSIEKRSSIDLAPRLTRVMFCSPVDNPALATQERRKIIKSNLKGSNKSFVFEESASVSRSGRKRSYTQSDAEDTRAKRSRLTEDLQQSVNRLSRPRTTSAAAKLTETTPKKQSTSFRSKSETKSIRTRLPNFAALHQKQFDKMESLDECQERKAKRARQMLTPTGSTNVLDRISPKNDTEPQKSATKEVAKPKDKTDTPTKKQLTLASLRPGFTRFGFKLNLDMPNPFTIPPKNDKPKEKPNRVAKRPVLLPSLVGATTARREVAKQTVMREKIFLEKKRTLKRNENRTIIKGVRTNRRFELQMKLRNIE